jgi:hypothetical protein
MPVTLEHVVPWIGAHKDDADVCTPGLLLIRYLGCDEGTRVDLMASVPTIVQASGGPFDLASGSGVVVTMSPGLMRRRCRKRIRKCK